MNNKIMVVTHKNTELMNDSLYQPILVGDKNFKIFNSIRDDEGKNIANKNNTFCELTALYNFWQNNLDLVEYIGLNHYRRYFTTLFFSNSKKNILKNSKLEKIMEKYDVILPNKFYWNKSVEKIYYENGAGRKKDLDLVEKAIKNLYPDYYNEYIKILNSNSASYCNMFIMDKNNLNNYCEWLFDILFYVEKHIDMTGYSSEESRVFGYISEILLNVWVNKNMLKIKYLPIAYTDCNIINQINKNIYNSNLSSKFKYIIKKLICKI